MRLLKKPLKIETVVPWHKAPQDRQQSSFAARPLHERTNALDGGAFCRYNLVRGPT